ncbi:cysteine-rich receptor-like protein kinase 41 [Oryza brachyantha]|uniref:cysteine-rich receptor-like protein kinase 41 n=1 Tax=Oryza brachyantha TaxID=4533 RepID=UPI001ADA3437|nr:cysteine-rich receptor-like protein kinase 41 [Oryza brachyantha]
MKTATFYLLLFHVFAFLSSPRTAGRDASITGSHDDREHAVAITGQLPAVPPAAPLASFALLFPSLQQIRGFSVVGGRMAATSTKGAGDRGGVVVWGIPWWEWGNPAAPSALRAALCRLYAEAYCGSFCSVGERRHRHVLVDDMAGGDEDVLQKCRVRCVAVADLPCHALGTGAETPYYSVIFDRLRWLVMNSLSLRPWVLLATTWIIVYFRLKYRMDNERRTEIRTIEHLSADEVVDLPRSRIASVASIDLPTMERATGGFSKRNIIGEGGFAIVYKGKLPQNHVLARDLHYQRKIAVKRLKPSAQSTKGLNDFTREVELMSRFRHGNLSRLLAYCTEGDERILVYEYMPKRSLDVYIFGTPKHRASLNWAKRLEIIHGMAKGVNYLHEGSREIVIHRDLKPSNVLLDDEFTPKIADFGATKTLVADDTGSQTIVFSP